MQESDKSNRLALARADPGTAKLAKAPAAGRRAQNAPARKHACRPGWREYRRPGIRSARRPPTKESMKDTARVLGRMYDAIEYRGYSQEIVEELAKYAGIGRAHV